MARPERLPLNDTNITWDQFESFSRDFVSELENVVLSHHYGTRGSKQKGIDLYADLAGTERWIFQCKQQRRFTKAHARAAVAKKTYRAPTGRRITKKTILVSCEVDSSVRDFIDGQPNWELWDVRDISKKVRELEIGAGRRLVEQHFGLDWRKLFLGLAPISPFLTPNQLFDRFLNTSRLFHHCWSLVGRVEALGELMAFVQAQNSTVGILPGRGGIGKSKLLHALADRVEREHREMLVWFVQEGVPLTPQAFDELPLRPTLIVVDDAHRREDLALLFAHAARRPNQIKLLLATRLHGIDGLHISLSRVGFDISETVTFSELKKLGREDARALALQALGLQFQHLADRLADATKDNPLVMVVGGQLLAQRAVAPELLERDTDFQHAVLDRFSEDLLGNVCNDDATACHELLKLISATAPVPLGNTIFLACAAKFLGRPTEWIVGRMGQLEKAGVLLRRGRLLRITPDVLSDHVLARACLSATGTSTGFADRVFTTFREWRAESVLSNLAELDWRVGRAKGKNGDLLTNIWSTIERDFAQGDWSQQYYLLGVVKEAAYFQPERAIRMARAAIDICTAKQRKRSDWIGPQHVLHSLPQILQRAAFSMEHLTESCELLWLLGRWDKRSVSHCSQHSLRILQELASYKTHKPAEFNRLILECAIRWLNDAKLHEYAHAPFAIFDELLKKEGESSRSEGAAVVISSFLICPDKSKALREHAIAALSRIAASAQPMIAFQALGSMGNVFHDAFCMAKPSAQYIQAWIPEKLQVIHELQRIAKERSEPLVLWKIHQVLNWPSQSSSYPEVRSAATTAISAIQDTEGLRFIRALMTEPLLSRQRLRGVTDAEWHKKYKEEDEERARFRMLVAEECVRRYTSPTRLLKALNQSLCQLEQAGCSVSPHDLIATIVCNSPKLGIRMAYGVIEDPESSVAKYFFAVTCALQQHSANAVPPLLEAAMKTKSARLRYALAHHFWSCRLKDLPGKRELRVLRRLLCHSDANASRLAIEALGALGRHKPHEAFKLLVRSRFETDSATANAACSCFHIKFGIDPANVTDVELKHFIARLSSVSDIEGHSIQELLSYAATRIPFAVVDLFIERIAKKAYWQNSDYRPIPFGMRVSFDEVAKHPDAAKITRRVRDLALRKKRHFSYFSTQLFWWVGGVHCLPVLREWLNSNVTAKIVAAAELLEGAGENFVFTDYDFVAVALNSSHLCGPDCYRVMLGRLRKSATSGTRSGTLGQPMPRDVEIKDKADQLAGRFSAEPIIRELYDGLRKDAEANMERDRYEFEEQFADD